MKALPVVQPASPALGLPVYPGAQLHTALLPTMLQTVLTVEHGMGLHWACNKGHDHAFNIISINTAIIISPVVRLRYIWLALNTLARLCKIWFAYTCTCSSNSNSAYVNIRDRRKIIAFPVSIFCSYIHLTVMFLVYTHFENVAVERARGMFWSCIYIV